jgi:trigger factor
MQVSIESGEGLERRMRVELPADQVQRAVEQKLQNLSTTVRMDGFRPGKVPLRLVRQRFGKSVRQEVIGDMIQSSFFEAARKQEVKPAGQPRIEDLDLDAASYVAVFEVVPQVILADLSAQEVKRPQVSVTDDDVQAMIEKLRRQRASWVVVERTAEEGDQLMISFKGLIDGEPFDGGSAEDVPVVLGSGSLLDGFESGLVGASSGDSRSLALTFPDDYRVAKLAGKAATFEVEVKEVRNRVLPEIDEAFIKEFGIASGDRADFNADIRRNLEHELKQNLRSTIKDRVMNALLAANSFQVPSALVDQEAEELRKQARANFERQGHGSSLQLPLEIFKDQARRRISLGLLLAEIIDKQQLKVDQERVSAIITEFAQTYEEPEEVVSFYKSNASGRSHVEILVMEDMVVDWVLGQVRVEDEPLSFDAFMNPQQS